MMCLRIAPARLSLLFLIFCLAALTACDREQPQVVSLDQRAPLPKPDVPSGKKNLTICVGSMITPQAGYVYYQQLIDYIADRLSAEITILDPGSYSEVNRLLETGRTDIAFVCAGPYVEGHDRFGLSLVAAPVVNGEPAYYSNLIVPADSPVRTLSDLRGKTFAFADPQSNTGALVPTAKLAEMGETPQSFFSSYQFTYGHDLSIHAVANHLVDGAAVDSLVWDYLAASEPGLAQKVRVVSRFGPYGIPPVVAGRHVDPSTVQALRRILLAMHEDPKGLKILKGMNIEGFVAIEDPAYDSVRQLQRRFGKAGK